MARKLRSNEYVKPGKLAECFLVFNQLLLFPGIIDIDGDVRTHSTLRIGNVTEADQGKIWCVAEYEDGMHDSGKADLTVVGKYALDFISCFYFSEGRPEQNVRMEHIRVRIYHHVIRLGG